MTLKTFAILPSFVLVCIALRSQTPDGTGPAQSTHIGQPSVVTIELLTEPPVLNDEQLAALERSLSTVNLPPPAGAQNVPPAGPTEPETTPSPLPVTPTTGANQAGDNRTGPLKVNIAESNGYLFYVGQSVAARSNVEESGSSAWNYINPSADMPDFCCEQAVIADPTGKLLIWYRQGMYSIAASQNRFVLSVSKDGGHTFCVYSVSPQDVDPTLARRVWESSARPVAMALKLTAVMHNIRFPV